MAAWKNLTPTRKADLAAQLTSALRERGIDVTAVNLDGSDLPGRYRLYVVSPDFTKLDYSERLSVLASALVEAWEREDRLRLTLQFPLAPDEVPLDDRASARATARARRVGPLRRRSRRVVRST